MLRNRFHATQPGYTGPRALGPYAQYVFGLPTSRAERGRRNCSYRPHQSGREMARRARN